MSVYGQILDWAKSRPLWQQDALRRIAESGDLTDADISELSDLCLAEARQTATGSTAIPLAAEHLPAPPSGEDEVTIKTITHTGGVNRLAPGAALSFATTGLTVVYGRNGSGKSGYGRILKQVCRARGRKAAILTNALDPSAASLTPSATIEYRCANEDHSYPWKQGDAPPDPLSRVSVFDADSAPAHVDGAMRVAYLPAGLDLLASLVQVCGQVEERLRQRLTALEASRWSPPGELFEHPVIKGLLDQLGSPGALDALMTQAQVTEEHRQRLAAVESQLSIVKDGDPHKEIAQLRLTAQRLRAAADRLHQLVEGLQDQVLQEFATLVQQARDAREAADVAGQALAEEPLTDVGGGAWRQLWQAARMYAQVAYPEKTHPHTEPGARCVLCQQLLSEEAASRLRRFEAFVSGQVQQVALEAEAAASAKARVIEQLPLGTADGAADELEVVQLGLGDLFREVVDVANRRAAVLSKLSTGTEPTALIDMAPAWPVLQAEQLLTLATAQETRAAELERARNPEARAQLEQERLLLSAVMTLDRHRDAVRKEDERRRREQELAKARSSCATRWITMKQTELAEAGVTTLSGRFADELRALGGGRIPAVLQPAPGQRGIPYQRVSLEGRPASRVVEILSEGELRVAALAGFLTDLAATQDRSALIFDDPVSSLDAGYREKVAQRLVQEASVRQVIVFTHDLAFLAFLYEQTKAHGRELTYLELGWVEGSPGQVVDDPQPDGAPVNKRLGIIRDRLAKAQKHYAGPHRDDTKWAREAEWMAGQLRKAWERAVETHLLYEAVQRHCREIQTQRVLKIRVQEADTSELYAAIKMLSRWGPHDGSNEMNLAPPSPDDIEKAIEQLKAWCGRVHPDTRPKEPAATVTLQEQAPTTVS